MAMIASLLAMAFSTSGSTRCRWPPWIIALGMLVDNAIVMAESIMVHMTAGRRPVEAAVGSARELRVPLLISSLTTAAAFLPISLAQSTTGEYTAPPLFKVITIALLLIACLRRPALTLAGIIGVFLLAMQGFRIIANIFFPPSDKAIFTRGVRASRGIERCRRSPPGTRSIPAAWGSERTLRCLQQCTHSETTYGNGAESPWPIPFTIRSWTQSHSGGLLEPAVDAVRPAPTAHRPT